MTGQYQENVFQSHQHELLTERTIFLEFDSNGAIPLLKKKSFPLRFYSVNVTKPAVSADFITFTEEILNGKLHFLCSVQNIKTIHFP